MAKILFIVTDMGNGGAFCSNCNYCLDGGDPLKVCPDTCPQCQETFTDSETYINQGGSDF